MTREGRLRRMRTLASALRMARELDGSERLPRAELDRLCQQRLEAVVRHAVAHSSFWRERIGDGPVELDRLPVLTKATMMERFDELVTDPRLRRDALLEELGQPAPPALHHGDYRVMATSGSSGLKGLFVYDCAGWRAITAQFLRYSAMVGVRPRLPRRMRVAAVVGASPTHMSRQVSAAVSVGIHRVLVMPVTMPVAELVARLNRFQPEFLNLYPSVAGTLAEEQLAGRLRLSLASMSTSSELCTPALAERLHEAFGVRPFNLYATTEGLWGCDCEQHSGIHLFDDATLVENVDADDRPVPPGTPGHRLLVTNLHNLVQPIIRLELADSMTLNADPCECGRTLVRATRVDGRSDDVLELPGTGERLVRVLPLEFALVTRDRDVREFQVRQDGHRLRLLVVPRPGAGKGLEDRLRLALASRLAELGVAAPRVEVERRAVLERSPGGKLQVVVAERPGPHLRGPEAATV